MDEQLRRIRTMEQALNDSAAAVWALQDALEHYQAALPLLCSLAEYYESPLWLQDHDDDAAGRLPAGLLRGVLSEDALYDLLTEHRILQEALARLGQKG